ncbi:MAG: radical SAM protein [Halopseudomonas sp.]
MDNELSSFGRITDGSQSQTIWLIRVDQQRLDGEHPRHRHAPLDLLWVRQQVRDAGCPVELIDLWMPQAEQRLAQPLPAVAVLKADSGCIDESQALAQRLQQQGVVTIAVGHQVHSLRTLPACWDFALLGEFELALPELLLHVQQDKDLLQLKAEYRQRLQQGVIGQVDSPDRLPSIVFEPQELLDYPFSLPVPGRAIRRWGYVQTAWGCPYDCHHCTELVRKSSGRSLRLRSVPQVVADIKALQASGVEGVVFEDDTLLCHKEHFLALCDGIRQAGIALPWVANARPDELCSERVNAAASSGAVLLKLGIESGSPRQIEQIGKSRSGLRWLEQTHDGVLMMNRHGIAALGLMMVGLPGETEQDVAQSRSLLQQLPLHYLQLQLFTAYPDVSLVAKPVEAATNQFHYRLIGCDSDAETLRALADQQRLYRSFYVRFSWIARHLRSCWRWYLTGAAWKRLFNYGRYIVRSFSTKPARLGLTEHHHDTA